MMEDALCWSDFKNVRKLILRFFGHSCILSGQALEIL